MAITQEQNTQILRSISSNGPYTHQQAREIMKVLNQLPTGTTTSIRWINVKTRGYVAFSY